MPYPPEHRERTRRRILRSARELFNRHGFTQVKIDDVMKHAGLTRGGFYSYFDKKSELYAEAVGLALAETPWSRWDGVDVDFSAEDAARQLIVAYLSRQHAEDVDGSCPMVTVPGDVARSDRVVRGAFEKVFTSMADLFDETLRRERRADRTRALAIASLCVGAMVVARSVQSDKLSTSIREAAKATALALGRWEETPPGKAARRPKGTRTQPTRHGVG
jgi:AcrR family transcriptional regulator